MTITSKIRKVRVISTGALRKPVRKVGHERSAAELQNQWVNFIADEADKFARENATRRIPKVPQRRRITAFGAER